jgi:hypothetical protein
MKKKQEAIVKKFGYLVLAKKSFTKAIIKIAPSKKFGGVGVFALRDLKEGTKISEERFMGESYFLRYCDFRKVDNETKKVITDFCANSEDGFFMPRDINYLSIPWHMNHCCNGNVGLDKNGNFVTIKGIRKGEELFYDYGFVMSDPKYRLICKCGNVNCRKIVTGNDWKNHDYAKNNYKYFSPEIKYLLKIKYQNGV